ncbi:MAG: 50S ribosomal protein L30, partial [Eubacterium sp.]|nr:50S ribosomal protein L30 [Eubacterium sp.]
IIEGIGLRKLNKTVELPDNDATRGIIRQVGYLLKVEE